METPLLICVRVLDMEVEPAEGSVQMICAECGAAIWVARASQGMLRSGSSYRLVCMQCASEISKAGQAEREQDQSIPAQIARMQSQAEAAYDEMYELHDDREIRWQWELADDLLVSAVKMARDAALLEQAEQIEQRRQHIRRVYYQQFAQTPHLLM